MANRHISSRQGVDHEFGQPHDHPVRGLLSVGRDEIFHMIDIRIEHGSRKIIGEPGVQLAMEISGSRQVGEAVVRDAAPEQGAGAGDELGGMKGAIEADIGAVVEPLDTFIACAVPANDNHRNMRGKWVCLEVKANLEAAHPSIC
jgi:hypothetical protein